MNELSRSKVNKLGERLRSVEAPSVDDLEMLEKVRRAHEDARREVVETLRREGLKGTDRPKTTSTIIEKLRRESGMNLSRMQDIAGVRLVIEGTRNDQDRTVERILELFPDARTSDRREKPSYGYRAVHVIVRVQGWLVEVQVRTQLQDQWAQIMERLADRFGRQIRYGDPPSQPDTELAPGVTRQALVDVLMSFSEEVDGVERTAVLLSEVEREIQETEPVDPTLSTRLVEVRSRVVETEAEIRSTLERLYAVLDPTANDGSDS